MLDDDGICRVAGVAQETADAIEMAADLDDGGSRRRGELGAEDLVG